MAIQSSGERIDESPERGGQILCLPYNPGVSTSMDELRNEAEGGKINDLVARLSEIAERRKVMLCTAESCTGGMLAAALTRRAGASCVFDRGMVCYSNSAKEDLLGVPAEILKAHGAVSEETAAAMCRGAGDFSMSITGVAGPGASAGKPAGTVCFGWRAGEERTETQVFRGDRDAVRTQAVHYAIRGMIAMLENAN